MSDQAPKASVSHTVRKLLTTLMGTGESGLRAWRILMTPLPGNPPSRETAIGVTLNLLAVLLGTIGSDRGKLLAYAGIGGIAHLVGVVLIHLRRDKSPTQADRAFLLLGWFLGMILTLVFVALLSNLFWYMHWHRMLGLGMRTH